MNLKLDDGKIEKNSMKKGTGCFVCLKVDYEIKTNGILMQGSGIEQTFIYYPT